MDAGERVVVGKFEHFGLAEWNLEVIALKKYAIRFSIGPLRFSLRTPEDLLNLLESLEKNVEVPWKNERYTPSAQ